MATRHRVTTKGGTYMLEVEGASEIRRALRRAGDKDVPKRLRMANKTGAELVKDRAVPKVPVLTGKLQRSVKAMASQSSGSVKAGSPSRVPYAPPIHWGWPARGIRQQRFIWDARDEVLENGKLQEVYEKAVDAALRDVKLK